MRGGLVVGVGVGVALLVAALAGVEHVAEHQPSAEPPSAAEMPVFVSRTPDTLPSVPEVEDTEGLASPAFTR